jgi:hypothetical protein
MMKRLILVTIVLLLLTIPAGAVFAEPYFDTVVEEGETINNDVIVFDGDLEIQESAQVNGDVIVFNGDAKLAGTINGDLVIFNGDLDADTQAAINGDCVLLNGSIDNRSSSEIRCTNIEGAALPGFVKGVPPIPAVPAIPAIPDAPDVPETPRVPPVHEMRGPSRVGSAFADFMRTIVSSLLLGGLAFVMASAFPNNLLQVKATMRKKPVASGAVGFLTALAVPIVVAILALISAVLTIICIGLLGFPIILLILLALVAAIAMGWIAAGTWLGERLFQRRERSLAMKAAMGTFLLTFVLGLLGILSGGWLEGLLGIAITSIGLGAVALTQFGRRSYSEQDGSAAAVDEDADKISLVLDTLPDDDPQDPISKA